MTATNAMRTVALIFMALAIGFGGFQHVVPGWLEGYFAAASVVCVGLGGLFTHPPGAPADNPVVVGPSEQVVVTPQAAPASRPTATGSGVITP